MNRLTVWTLAAVVGVVAGGISYGLGTEDPALTATVMVSYALVVVLSARHPDTVYQSDVAAYAAGPWSGAAIGFLLAVVLLGVGWSLPLGDEIRLSLQILLLGAGYAMWLFGISYARAKADA